MNDDASWSSAAYAAGALAHVHTQDLLGKSLLIAAKRNLGLQLPHKMVVRNFLGYIPKRLEQTGYSVKKLQSQKNLRQIWKIIQRSVGRALVYISRKTKKSTNKKTAKEARKRCLYLYLAKEMCAFVFGKG